MQTRKQLRQFGLLVGSVLLLLGCVYWYRGHHDTARDTLWGIGGVLVLLGLVAPQILAPIAAGWAKFGHVLGWINTRIILGLIFFLVMTPIGLVIRLLRRDLIGERLDRNAPSYWIETSPHESVKEHCERQF